MFSFKSWLKTQRPPDDDELISVYIDGALDGAARQAFEARLASEPDLRRRVDATRRLVQAAAQLPPAGLPRNFTLPASMGKPALTYPSLWLRMGSAVAAAVFVLAIGLDVSGVLAPRTVAPAAAPVQQAYRSFAAQASSAPAATEVSETGSMSVSAEDAANAAPAEAPAETGEVTAEPLMMSAEAVTNTAQSYGSVIVTDTTATPPAIMAKGLQSDTLPAGAGAADTTSETQAQRSAAQPEPTLTAEATVAEVAPATEPPVPTAPETPWLRIVAGLALVIAVGTGIAGWARR
jgi:hypothetical protein